MVQTVLLFKQGIAGPILRMTAFANISLQVRIPLRRRILIRVYTHEIISSDNDVRAKRKQSKKQHPKAVALSPQA